MQGKLHDPHGNQLAPRSRARTMIDGRIEVGVRKRIPEQPLVSPELTHRIRSDVVVRPRRRGVRGRSTREEHRVPMPAAPYVVDQRTVVPPVASARTVERLTRDGGQQPGPVLLGRGELLLHARHRDDFSIDTALVIHCRARDRSPA
ncbi:hypothetical protein MTP03_19380 [Tsukamurella sp. PLM1]|nr:hypothetical protein MTP03_19380 [Tsukamurella sp. PLM1]